MRKKEESKEEKLKKEIVIARLLQAPPTIKISLGMTGGKFLERDRLIKEVKDGTEIGKKIVDIQFAYIKALKNGLTLKEE